MIMIMDSSGRHACVWRVEGRLTGGGGSSRDRGTGVEEGILIIIGLLFLSSNIIL